MKQSFNGKERVLKKREKQKEDQSKITKHNKPTNNNSDDDDEKVCETNVENIRCLKALQ